MLNRDLYFNLQKPGPWTSNESRFIIAGSYCSPHSGQGPAGQEDLQHQQDPGARPWDQGEDRHDRDQGEDRHDRDQGGDCHDRGQAEGEVQEGET